MTIAKTRPKLFIATILLLPFSYYPLVNFGTFSGLHIDVSLLYIVCLLMLLAHTPYFIANMRQLLQSPLFLLCGFGLFCLVSVAWSENLARGLVTSLFGLFVIALCIMSHHYADLITSKKIFQYFSILFWTMIAWATWQIFGDMLNAPSWLTLLPSMYDSHVFGIARPTGFALEPQFFASILLIPFAWISNKLLQDKSLDKSSIAGFIAVTVFILLTLSRGGIIAMILIALLLLALVRSDVRKKMWYCGLIIVSIFASLLVTYSAASIRTDRVSGSSAVEKVVNHISLGMLSSSKQDDSDDEDDDGYVKSSTTSRVSSSSTAVKLWLHDPFTTLLGVGIGAFGANTPGKNPAYIVNNYYLELIAETGLVGFGLLASFILLVLRSLFLKKQFVLFALLIGLLVQACFFSGNANILHIWVVIGIGLSYFHTKSSRK